MKYMYMLLTVIAIAYTGDSHASGVQWMTNYDQAVQQAKSTNKPLLLFFTGSDWCGWCKKLDSEALDTSEFAQMAGNSFVFVLVDFPSKKKLPPAEAEQNKQLQQKFNVKGYPTVILLDPNQQQIGVTGYRPGGGKAYAEHLQKMVQDYSGYKQKMSALDHRKLSGTELKALYEKAQEFHCQEDIMSIVHAGIQTEDSSFFMLERMRILSANNQLETEEAVTLREQLLSADPTNAQSTHYHLAVIDFESRYKEMKQNKRSIDSTLTPLHSYIEKFGHKDRENLWRLNMIISQVLYDTDDYNQALKYANNSYNTAPRMFQNDIAEVIHEINIKTEYQR